MTTPDRSDLIFGAFVGACFMGSLVLTGVQHGWGPMFVLAVWTWNAWRWRGLYEEAGQV